MELLVGRVDPTTFAPEVLENKEIEALACRIETVEVDHPDPNAFFPQRLQVEFSDGSTIDEKIPYAWGHPELPMEKQAREEKFALCWELARDGQSANPTEMSELMSWIEKLEDASNCQKILDLLV